MKKLGEQPKLKQKNIWNLPEKKKKTGVIICVLHLPTQWRELPEINLRTVCVKKTIVIALTLANGRSLSQTPVLNHIQLDNASYSSSCCRHLKTYGCHHSYFRKIWFPGLFTIIVDITPYLILSDLNTQVDDLSKRLASWVFNLLPSDDLTLHPNSASLSQGHTLT